MFILSPSSSMRWNLQTMVGYEHRDDGTFVLIWSVGGGRVKIRPDHPQYRQISQYLASTTLGPDAA